MKGGDFIEKLSVGGNTYLFAIGECFSQELSAICGGDIRKVGHAIKAMSHDEKTAVGIRFALAMSLDGAAVGGRFGVVPLTASDLQAMTERDQKRVLNASCKAIAAVQKKAKKLSKKRGVENGRKHWAANRHRR